MQLTATQRRAVLALAVLLLAVGLAPWPTLPGTRLHAAPEAQVVPLPRGVCPLGFSAGDFGVDLPDWHSPVPVGKPHKDGGT